MANEKRLIDVAKEIQAMCSMPETRRILETDHIARKVIDWFIHAPTVDAVEVKHGWWIWHEEEFEYECSVCNCKFDYNHTFGIFDHGYEYGNYCPNCGAKMDGDGNG